MICSIIPEYFSVSFLQTKAFSYLSMVILSGISIDAYQPLLLRSHSSSADCCTSVLYFCTRRVLSKIIWLSCLLGLFQLRIVPWSCLDFHELENFQANYLVDGPQFGFVWRFLTTRFRLCISGRNSPEMILGSSHCSQSHNHDFHCTLPLLLRYYSDHLIQMVSARLLHCKLLFFFLFVINKYFIGR